jgi:hypothetical protein
VSPGDQAGRDYLRFAAYIGLAEIGVANVFAQIGATIGEIGLAPVRVMNFFGISNELQSVPMVKVGNPYMGEPLLSWPLGLWGEVQRGLNRAYAHEWHLITGEGH